jgi:opacity protein-like surface antigen
MVFSQDAKWYVGMHGGPMLNVTEEMSGQGGFQLAPGIYFSKNQRFEIGLLPSYTKFVIEGYSDVPISVNESYVLSDRIQTHHTGMMNAQVRYTFNTRLLQPYGIAHWGVGIIHQVDEQEVWYGGTTTDTYGAFSFGFGLGLQYILTDSVRLDFNVQASGMDDFGDRTPEYFIRPLLGVIMQI